MVFSLKNYLKNYIGWYFLSTQANSHPIRAQKKAKIMIRNTKRGGHAQKKVMYMIDNIYRNIRKGNDLDWDGLNNEDDWEQKKCEDHDKKL